VNFIKSLRHKVVFFRGGHIARTVTTIGSLDLNTNDQALRSTSRVFANTLHGIFHAGERLGAVEIEFIEIVRVYM
jgi:hypothetical protein